MVATVASSALADKRPQLFFIEGGALFTMWKVNEDPNAAWSSWTQFSAPGKAQAIRAAALTDRRPQLWSVTDAGLFSTWKLSKDPNAQWTGWGPFPAPPGFIRSIATMSLTDGRPQLLADTDAGLFSTWKVSKDPNAQWSGWSQFVQPPGSIINSIGAMSLSDGRIQLWAETDAGLFSLWKLRQDPNSAWSSWMGTSRPAG